MLGSVMTRIFGTLMLSGTALCLASMQNQLVWPMSMMCAKLVKHAGGEYFIRISQ